MRRNGQRTAWPISGERSPSTQAVREAQPRTGDGEPRVCLRCPEAYQGADKTFAWYHCSKDFHGLVVRGSRQSRFVRPSTLTKPLFSFLSMEHLRPCRLVGLPGSLFAVSHAATRARASVDYNSSSYTTAVSISSSDYTEDSRLVVM